jgi:hypothetical protein
MFGFIREKSENVSVAAIITSALSAVASIVCVYLTYQYATSTQDRQVRLEQVSKFDTNSSQLIEAGGQFIAAINDNKDLSGAKVKMRTVVASQIHDSENLRKFFDGPVSQLVSDYQSAISELNDVAQKTSNPTEMRPWTESFGRALDAKASLSTQLYSTIGKTKV